MLPFRLVLFLPPSTLNTTLFRQLFITTTFYNDLAMLTSSYQLWNATIPTLAVVPGIQYSITYQPIPPAMTSKSAPLGGNSLGLESLDRALVLVLLTAAWEDLSNDVLVETTTRDLINKIDARARATGQYYRFKYLNYAYSGQDIFDGYGAANKAKLRATSRKYDHFGIFQNAVPGGFKLFR
jgi:hypothetical protein